MPIYCRLFEQFVGIVSPLCKVSIGKGATVASLKRMPDKPGLARASRRAAITLTMIPGSQKTYVEIMSIARDRIKISEIRIPEVRSRRTISGALALEIPGKESVAKVDILAGHLKKIFPETGDKDSSPYKESGSPYKWSRGLYHFD